MMICQKTMFNVLDLKQVSAFSMDIILTDNNKKTKKRESSVSWNRVSSLMQFRKEERQESQRLCL